MIGLGLRNESVRTALLEVRGGPWFDLLVIHEDQEVDCQYQQERQWNRIDNEWTWGKRSTIPILAEGGAADGRVNRDGGEKA